MDARCSDGDFIGSSVYHEAPGWLDVVVVVRDCERAAQGGVCVCVPAGDTAAGMNWDNRSVSTAEGLASHLVTLEVVVPRAVIPGQEEHHVEAGSTISLTCFIEQSPVAPQYIFWYHNARMINYDRERGGVTVHIEAQPKVASLLRVRDARPEDSGNYTCAAANTESASVTVYITEAANKIAAVQPRAPDSSAAPVLSFPLLLSLLLLAPLLHYLSEL
ncbi:hypothetical protein E2C01_002852 [Portunus trituberculatus]|uniref:Ig-like domain-containing protein n=1 Tax=Portunus trituberculatus TaxID=210409 RepID=A0A5B7CLD5_PORTR|nr:hypothetical protein [Portunus trituberculatus]